MKLRYWLIMILILVSGLSQAQFKIDSVLIIRKNIQYTESYDNFVAIPMYPHDTEFIRIAFSSIEIVNGTYRYSGADSSFFGYVDSISFSFDTSTNRITDFGYSADYMDGSEAIDRIDHAVLDRIGNDYRIYLLGAELTSSGYSYYAERTIFEDGNPGHGSRTSAPPTDSSSVEITLYGSILLDVPREHELASASLHPNPASNYVTIRLEEPVTLLTICDLLGREIKTVAIASEQKEVTIEVSQLRDGVYWLRAGKASRKLVICK